MAPITTFGCWRYVRRRTTSQIVCTFILLPTIWVVIRYLGSDRRKAFNRTTQIYPDVINSSYYQYLHREHQIRTKHLRQHCQGRQQELFGLYSEKWAYGRIEINTEDLYTYCPVYKVGSTFWNRIFYTMRKKNNQRNPYKVSIGRALSAKRNYLSELLPLNSPSASNFLARSTSIIFVREPFSRLLSGYVDKLFSPNPYFWEEIGRHVISKFRPTASQKEMHCGSDVTFEEFVRYVIDSEVTNNTHRDAHFSPTYDQCKPCTLNYTVIGKMETFKTDVFYTLAQLGYKANENHISAWGTDEILDAIMDSTTNVFGWEDRILKCMTWTEAFKRVWRKLQIRGILLLEDKFPWIPQYSERMLTIRIFSETVRRLHVISDKEKLKRQKSDVLAATFSHVKPGYIEKIAEIFRPDFDLFQYDSRPNFIYDEDFVNKFRQKNSIFDLRYV